MNLDVFGQMVIAAFCVLVTVCIACLTAIIIKSTVHNMRKKDIK